MKQKGLFIATIIFFLIVNSSYFWEAKVGNIGMLIFTILMLYFFILMILLLVQILSASKENFKNRRRLLLIILIMTVLFLSFCFPGGLINFERFESESILLAKQEGAANCKTTLKLRKDKTFIERNICFGVTETTGTYIQKADTIFFDHISLGKGESSFYKFAVIKMKNNSDLNYLGDLVGFKEYSDSTGTALWIIKNNLPN